MTTFIIVSLTWLQQDNTQVSMQLLAQLSLQMGGAAPVNRTLVDTAQGSRQFNPNTISIWINILWALSLLFSLAAALASIITKQWLREYLLWDSVLFHPREAVLLRHIRYDAWEQWKVPEIISAIPAMLEIALLLFLCGAVILLWTLNNAVAIAVTFFGAAFFVLACAVNILPIAFHRCPYKSAVGWTCVSAWSLARRWVFALRMYARRVVSARQQRHQTRALRLSSLHTRAGSWRQRDLQRHRQWGMQIHWEVLPEMDRQPRLEVAELVILFHALAWVCTRTQDERLLDKVQQCTRNFYGNNRKHLCLNAGVYAASQLLELDAPRFFTSLRRDIAQEPLDRSDYGLYSLSMITYSRRAEQELWQGNEPEGQSFTMACNVLLSVAQTFMLDLFPVGPNARYPDPEEVDAFMEALCFLSHVMQSSEPDWRHQFAGMLSELYNRLTEVEVPGPWLTQDPSGPRYPGLKTPVLQLLARASVVELSPNGEMNGTRHPSYGQSSVIDDVARFTATPLDDRSHTDFPRLAIQIFRNNPNYVRVEDRHLFTTIANMALRRSIHAADIAGDVAHVQELLACIEDAARLSVDKHIVNLGSLSLQPQLLETVLWFAQQNRTISVHLISPGLLEALEANFDASLFPGEQASEQVQQLTRLIRKRGSSHIRWESDRTAVDDPTQDLEQGLSGVASVNGFHDHRMSRGKVFEDEMPGPSMPVPCIPAATFSVVKDGDVDVELGSLAYAYPSPRSDSSGSPVWSR